MSFRWRRFAEAPRLAPLRGAAIGAAGAAVYWLGAQIWPTSVAVVLSMLATALLNARTAGWAALGTTGAASAAYVLVVLIKYDALMALSAANLPFTLPANVALGFIIIAGNASSRALAMTAVPRPSKPASTGSTRASTPPSSADLVTALALGFAPAALIGIPGLIGLAAAILARLAYAAYDKRDPGTAATAKLGTTQYLTEVCFYLGALAGRSYV